jgi:hypothetical protein
VFHAAKEAKSQSPCAPCSSPESETPPGAENLYAQLRARSLPFAQKSRLVFPPRAYFPMGTIIWAYFVPFHITHGPPL